MISLVTSDHSARLYGQVKRMRSSFRSDNHSVSRRPARAHTAGFLIVRSDEERLLSGISDDQGHYGLVKAPNLEDPMFKKIPRRKASSSVAKSL